jgi:hypothetical protein
MEMEERRRTVRVFAATGLLKLAKSYLMSLPGKNQHLRG